jgi:hypothetical protein
MPTLKGAVMLAPAIFVPRAKATKSPTSAA